MTAHDTAPTPAAVRVTLYGWPTVAVGRISGEVIVMPPTCRVSASFGATGRIGLTIAVDAARLNRSAEWEAAWLHPHVPASSTDPSRSSDAVWPARDAAIAPAPTNPVPGTKRSSVGCGTCW